VREGIEDSGMCEAHRAGVGGGLAHGRMRRLPAR
jgi:hypothetical protein